MTDTDGALRCGNCHCWLGEATVELVRIEVLEKGAEATIRPPRDLRLCKQCRRVNVFVPKADLDLRRDAPVASA